MKRIKTPLVILLVCLLVGCSAPSAKTDEVSKLQVEENNIIEEQTSSDPEESSDVENITKPDSVTYESVSEEKSNEEIYLEAVRNLYKNNVDLFGKEVMGFGSSAVWNHFAIYDIDDDGIDELILSCEGGAVAWMWGGVYQYDADKGTYIDEGLTEPEITFYDNGIAYEGWRHNQGPGEMWPFDAYRYNANTDKYEHVFSADSWNKSLREEGFPEDADTDGAGVVYFTDADSQYIDYNRPISQSEFDALYDTYFGGATVIQIKYYEVSGKGIEEYKMSK